VFTPDEANAIILAYRWGYISADDVNDLATTKVKQFNGVPPANICELAICKRDLEICEILGDMSIGSDKWVSLRCFLESHIRLDNLNNSGISRLASHIGHYVDWDDAEPWSNFKLLDHEIGDARIGAYGDYDELCLEFRTKLSNILKKA